MSDFEWEKHLKPLISGAIILLLLGGILGYHSYRQSLASLDRKIVSTRKELGQLQRSLQEYRLLETKLRGFKRQNSAAAGHNLITSIENAAEKIGARSQLVYVRPQPDKTHDDLLEEGVEIRLVKLQLHQLVELLYQFEQSAQRLRISQLRIRTRFDDREKLDASMILSRFREAG